MPARRGASDSSAAAPPGGRELKERVSDLVVWAELVALAARDAFVRCRLQGLWHQRWLPMMEHELETARPRARAAKISEVTYAIACLVEAQWNLKLQGIDQPERRRQAQANARLLLDSMPQ